jgi:hypothetical protein
MKLLSFYDIDIPLIYQVGVKKDDTLLLLQNDQKNKKSHFNSDLGRYFL